MNSETRRNAGIGCGTLALVGVSCVIGAGLERAGYFRNFPNTLPWVNSTPTETLTDSKNLNRNAVEKVGRNCFVSGDIEVWVTDKYVKMYDSKKETALIVSFPEGGQIRAPFGASVDCPGSEINARIAAVEASKLSQGFTRVDKITMPGGQPQVQ